MQKRWVLKSKSDKNKINNLSKSLSISSVLTNLLLQRNIETPEDAKLFFRPSLENLHNPFLMKDMDKAIERIIQAIGNKEKIMIYGDYDVDGTTAVAVVFSFFRDFHTHLEYYIPDRSTEGYGISTQGIDYASEKGITLIIALDCGIKEVEKVAYAKQKGIDFIIGDHHFPGEELPGAIAILDPKRSDCTYPYKELSGCGIGFKLIQAFSIRNEMNMEQCYQYLDLVAVSIASDVVPITGENRILSHFGLIKLNTNPCVGLQALIDLSNNKNKIFTIGDIVFQIGPRINAAGRIKHGKDAVQLLISKSLPEAKNYSINIDDQNTERKNVDIKITEEALALIENNDALKAKNSTVLYHPDWHKGVIGIVASRLTEKYYRPTIILTNTNGHIAGSCRSVVGFDLYEALSECSDLLEQFGGHKYAAGLTMPVENITLFQDRFEEVVSKRFTPKNLTQEIVIDSELKLSEIDAKFFRILQLFEPTGPQNEKPVFVSRAVKAHGLPMVVGNNHLKMTIRQGNSAEFSCIAFGMSEHYDHIASGNVFDICYTLEENSWRGKTSLQLNIKGIKY